MPRIKQRSNLPVLYLEQWYECALQGLEDGTFKSLQKAAEAYNLSKYSLGHRKNGRRSRQLAHHGKQIFSPAAERAIVQWIRKLDNCGFAAGIDHLMSMIKALASDPKRRQIPHQSGQKNIIGKNWITQFLNPHPILVTKFASCIDRQRTYAGNPPILQDHFRKLGKVITERKIKPKAISNVDEKGFVMGISPCTKVITRRGKKNPRVTQSGNRELITGLEAVSADGFIFLHYFNGNGAKHIFDWYKNVTDEDKMARWAVTPKGWTDTTIGYDWLTEVYDPISRQRCPNETQLLILDGHVSHINYKFLKYCEQNDIIVFCLPAHSTHLLQPLDDVLFSALQNAYKTAVEDYFCLTSIGTNRDIFLPLYKQARMEAYTLHNIHQAFAATGIQPFNPRTVLANAKECAAHNKAAEDEALLGVEPEKIHSTKCELRLQTNQALQFRFSKTATSTTLCDLILHVSHAVEYFMTEADIARTESHNM